MTQQGPQAVSAIYKLSSAITPIIAVNALIVLIVAVFKGRRVRYNLIFPLLTQNFDPHYYTRSIHASITQGIESACHRS